MNKSYRYAINNLAFTFLQWCTYLSLLARHKADLGTTLIYKSIALQFLPLSIVPLLLLLFASNKSVNWSKLQNGMGLFVSAALLVVSISKFQNDTPLYDILLLISSTLLGLSMSRLSGLCAFYASDAAQLKKYNSTLTAGYYLGILSATVMFSASWTAGCLWAPALASTLTMVIATYSFWQGRDAFSTQTSSLSPVSADPLTTLSEMLRGEHGVLLFILTQLLRYFAWGLLAFMFPLAVMKRMEYPIQFYSILSSVSIGTMLLASLSLSYSRVAVYFSNALFWALFCNIANGVLVFLSYSYAVRGSNILAFFVPYFFASFVSIISDVKISSYYVATFKAADRPKISILSMLLRFVGVSVGNVTAYFFVATYWNSLAFVILICLLLSSLSFFAVVKNREASCLQY